MSLAFVRRKVLSKAVRHFNGRLRFVHHSIAKQDRIAVGVSGGVDSAVAALLLKQQGHDLLGIFMRNWDEGEETGNQNCSVEEDARAASAVCRHLGIPFREVDFVAEYWTKVFEDFLEQFGRGLTPNPDLACNRHIKFDALIRHAAALGCASVATGHHARIDPGNPPKLLRGMDTDKDQSYFLASVHPDSLRHARFPLGELTKPTVRQIAIEAGLAAAAERRSSAGICFIGRRKFGDFLEQYLPPLPGRYRDLATSADLGPCANLLSLTVGQRAPLGGGPMRSYIAGKDVRRRIAHVVHGNAFHPALLTRSALLRAPHWLDGGVTAGRLETEQGGIRCTYKARYGQSPRACTLRPLRVATNFVPSALCRLSPADEAVVVPSSFLVADFDDPAVAITPQQAFVMYDGEHCLGSALIARPGRTLAEEDGWLIPEDDIAEAH